jgi:polysaccharide pyruvyl transferase WcaK-like protein
MNIVFVSFIDSSNIGDQLIVEVLEEKLMKDHAVSKYSLNLIPENEITINNSIPHRKSGRSKVKNFYNNFIRKNVFVDKLLYIRMKRRMDRNQFLPTFIDDIKKCDLLVIGGGNAIFDLTPHSLSAYKFNKILNVAKDYRKKIFVTSIGLGPFKTKKQIDYTIRTLKLADYVTVRDEKSYDYIKSLGDKVHLSIDPVFLLEKMTDKNMEKERKTISICIIDLFLNKDTKEKYDNYIDGLSKLINQLQEKGYLIYLFSTEPRDYKAVHEVFNKVTNSNNIEIKEISNLNELIKLYGNTDLIIGTRMHSLIVGLSQLIPVIGLSWQDKVNEMFEMVNLSDDVINIEDLEENIVKIVKLVEEKLATEHLIHNLEEIKSENHQKFQVNHNLINKVIQR